MGLLKRKRLLRKTVDDYMVDILAYIACTFALLATAYPFIYTLSASISNPDAVVGGDVFLWPVGFSLEAYRMVFREGTIWTYYLNTIYYTSLGAFLSVVATCLTAYPLARRKLVAKKFLTKFVTIPMYVNAGLIPFFLIVVKTGLYNTRWAIVVPTMISVFNLIVCITFFKSVPEEMVESGLMDGCPHIKILYYIVLPVSKAVIAVLIIFYGVAQWNSWFPALLFLKDDNMQPLQIFLRRLLLQTSPEAMNKMVGSSTSQSSMMSFLQLKYAVIIVVIGPIILIYPFLQKYFVKGVMLGSLKG